MKESFKQEFDKFVTDLIIKIDKKEIIPEIQKKYENIIDLYSKLTILSKEEFEEIDKDIINYENETKTQKIEINDLTQKLKKQTEIYEDKIEALTFQLNKKFQSDENLEKLTEEYSLLHTKYKSCLKENNDYIKQIQDLNKTIQNLQNESKKISNENFEKFQLINKLQNKDKILEENNAELKIKTEKFFNENNELVKKNKELDDNMKYYKLYFEEKVKNLNTENEKIKKANQNLTKESISLKNKLKEYETYIDYAKVSSDKLDKKDFSILEVMSVRAQKAESELCEIKEQFKKINEENKELKDKNNELETLTNYYFKIDSYRLDKDNLNVNLNMNDLDFQSNNNNENLFNFCVNLKKENFILRQQMQDITIECNRRLRAMNE